MRVAVLGGGVAGLSAAHELAERGFDVQVFERGSVPGGKARSLRVPVGEGPPLPGEHGFRFFAHFYRHLPDTMRRIPFHGNVNGVEGNLVGAHRGLMARPGLPPVEMLTAFPHSREDAALWLRIMFGDHGGLASDDIEFFSMKLWRLITSCAARRLGEYERIAWAQFIEAAKRSDTYRTWFVGLTRTFVAAAGDRASTRTMGDILVQLLLSSVHVSDRFLNGPTNDVFIDPWVRHLRSLGVEYTMNTPVTEFRCSGSRIVEVVVETDSGPRAVTADAYVAAVPVDRMAALVNDDMVAADAGLGRLAELAEHAKWMNGVQLYLTEDVPVVPGHALYVGAPWGLTSISQQQFWPTFRLSDCADGSVRGVISVDICDWDSPGLLEHRGRRRAAKECTLDEITADVWAQLKSCLNVDGEVVLRDELLHSSFLDPDIKLASADRPLATDLEPMLVNDAGTWTLRPAAYTAIPNLYLASDYVQTYTDLATMEGANEAARRAVNAILESSGSSAPRCAIWNLHEPAILAPLRFYDRERYARGLPWRSPPVGLRAASRGFHRLTALRRRRASRR